MSKKADPINTRIYRYRWVVLAAYMYVAALTQLYWLNFSAIDTYIEKNLGVSAMSTGWLALVFPLLYLILSLPAGFIIDKKGFKFGIGLGTIFTGIFSLVRLIDPSSYALILISQIGISIGQPFVLNGITKLVVAWFPPDEEATAIGLGSLSMFIGMIIGLGITPLLVDSLGFTAMLLIYGILGGIGIIFFFVFVKSRPPSPVREDAIDYPIPILQGIKNILKQKDFLILGFIALLGIGVFNGIATWLEKILNELHQISMVDAGTISSILIFSGMLGCIIVPFVSDRVQKRKPFLILASFIGSVCSVVLLIQNNFWGNIGNGIFLGFFLLSALPIMFTMSLEITGEKYAGISIAYLQLLGNGAAVVIVPFMEFLHGVSGGYSYPLIFLTTLLVLGSILSSRIGETGKSLETAEVSKASDSLK